MQNLKLLIGVIGGTLVLVLAIAFLFPSGQTTEEQTLADPAVTEADRRYVKVAETTRTEETENPEATESTETEAELITIVEFSDLQCPACRAAEPLVERVVDENPGRVELVYRHFPLESIHENAKEAAVASEIVGEQGLFWEYITVLFENQDDWANESDPTAKLIEYAQEVGADTTDFESKLDDNAYIDLVEADIRDGYTLGVNATPTFFVDGEQFNATQLSTAIEARL